MLIGDGQGGRSESLHAWIKSNKTAKGVHSCWANRMHLANKINCMTPKTHSLYLLLVLTGLPFLKLPWSWSRHAIECNWSSFSWYGHLKPAPRDVPAKNILIPTYILQGSLNRPSFLQRGGSKMSRVWAVAPSSQSFNPKPFMGMKMSALSRGCATFLGPRAPKMGLGHPNAHLYYNNWYGFT